ncbi:hypothetical protein DK871_16525 [Pseudomonas sp. L13]|nr:hypothetical protein [Pseudomonas sp. L13]
MQVAAMLRGGAGAMKVGEGGLWAMIERKLPGIGGARPSINVAPLKRSFGRSAIVKLSSFTVEGEVLPL